jgi:hypothetical protein
LMDKDSSSAGDQGAPERVMLGANQIGGTS